MKLNQQKLKNYNFNSQIVLIKSKQYNNNKLWKY